MKLYILPSYIDHSCRRCYTMVLSLMIGVVFLLVPDVTISQSLNINERGYFSTPGMDVTVFSDIYPDGHQTGVTIIQHGSRVAANGDLRLEASPGQWSPVPKGGILEIDTLNGTMTQHLWYPDSSKNRKGFNPIIYPDLQLSYRVEVSVCQNIEHCIEVKVHLDDEVNADWAGKIGFNFELFPGELFGKSWLMDDEAGIFYRQPNGPLEVESDEILTSVLASGADLTVAPEDPMRRLNIESLSGELELRDGRSNHNNGWYIVREKVQPGKTEAAIVWRITPNVVSGWKYSPIIQVSQVGYTTKQEKRAVFELDESDKEIRKVTLNRVDRDGPKAVESVYPDLWGDFLRYKYYTYDFSHIQDPGLYTVSYGEKTSRPFRIDDKVFDRHVWQPVLEYYLPVQMCHMRVNEKYRVWHDVCHLDDALMAPVDSNHFDGYVQGSSTLTDYDPMEPVPHLNRGGWHDAGDYDLRVESQIGTIWNLAMMIEEFGVNYDATSVDLDKRIVEIHRPDGKSDMIQQIEHGLSSVLGGYRALGRLYRGIICPTLRQYVMLGDAASMTDNIVYNQVSSTGGNSGESHVPQDDRWVFTEDNPARELYVAAGLAATSRVLAPYNEDYAVTSLNAAITLYDEAQNESNAQVNRILAACELYRTTRSEKYMDDLKTHEDFIVSEIGRTGWAVGRIIDLVADDEFKVRIKEAVANYYEELKAEQRADSPYGVPYKPNIWGAGWSIQRFGVEQYFFHKGWPEICDESFFLNALNFVLGVHPGANTSSFASGVGSESVLVAYGVNRADWSFIPGGVASGTALIRPDLPELKEWPFFWQQTEYVMGGGSTNFMFLALAADQHFNR